jgi:hypothetical protein
MGLLDFLFGQSKCPRCGTKGARKSQGQTRCPNPSCPNFDISLRANQARAGRISSPSRGDFSPVAPIEIRYRNFRGEEKTFTADTETLRRKRNHIIARVAPTGQSISLSRDRIQNREEVENAASPITESRQPGPTARERQVLGYHKKHKSTSPLYEEIRAKYPNW